jgi:hypothetical protein
MANLTADEKLRIKQALVKNDSDGSVTDRLVNVLNNDTGVASVSYSIGAEAGDVITVACQFKDSNGNDMTVPVGVVQYLASDATGQTVEAAATSLAAGTDGTILVEFTADAVWFAVSEADGDLDIAIGNAGGADTLHLVTVLPNGKLSISDEIVFA